MYQKLIKKTMRYRKEIITYAIGAEGTIICSDRQCVNGFLQLNATFSLVHFCFYEVGSYIYTFDCFFFNIWMY